MSTALTTPQIAASIIANLASGNPPAKATCAVNDATTIIPVVGTSTNNVNLCYSATRTVTSGSPDVLDLTALTDPLGNALNFAVVRTVKITNNGSTGQTITVGGGTNPLFASESEPIQALGGVHLTDHPDGGLAVSGTVKNLQISVAAGTSVSYTITILGK